MRLYLLVLALMLVGRCRGGEMASRPLLRQGRGGSEDMRFVAVGTHVSAADKAPVKGGMPYICQPGTANKVECCYMACEQCKEQCEAKQEDSDRQEDSDCESRRQTCFDECATGGVLTQGTHIC